MAKLRQVMLMIETSSAHARGLISGVAHYAMTHDQWLLCVKERTLSCDALRFLESWKGDGIIFRTTNRFAIAAIRRKRVPAVNTSSRVLNHGFPLVDADHDRIAQLAVAHFLERKFRNFAFCALENPLWVRWCREAYLRELAKLAIKPHVIVLGKSAEDDWDRQNRQLAEWATALPRPIAILAADDVCATRLIAACRMAGLRIPQEVAVLGVDNDEVLCRLTCPPLSSIDIDSPSIGHRAAALLDKMMAGAVRSAETTWVPARGVVTRQSTDTLAVDDADVVQAMRFIREHACDGINVRDVLQNVCISIATLERKFATWLQTTPQQALLRIRMERAKCLLAETSYAIERIAPLVGYRTQSHLSVAFKRETGLTPGEFRQQFRDQ